MVVDSGGQQDLKVSSSFPSWPSADHVGGLLTCPDQPSVHHLIKDAALLLSWYYPSCSTGPSVGCRQKTRTGPMRSDRRPPSASSRCRIRTSPLSWRPTALLSSCRWSGWPSPPDPFPGGSWPLRFWLGCCCWPCSSSSCTRSDEGGGERLFTTSSSFTWPLFLSSAGLLQASAPPPGGLYREGAAAARGKWKHWCLERPRWYRPILKDFCQKSHEYESTPTLHFSFWLGDP